MLFKIERKEDERVSINLTNSVTLNDKWNLDSIFFYVMTIRNEIYVYEIG